MSYVTSIFTQLWGGAMQLMSPNANFGDTPRVPNGLTPLIGSGMFSALSLSVERGRGAQLKWIQQYGKMHVMKPGVWIIMHLVHQIIKENCLLYVTPLLLKLWPMARCKFAYYDYWFVKSVFTEFHVFPWNNWTILARKLGSCKALRFSLKHLCHKQPVCRAWTRAVPDFSSGSGWNPALFPITAEIWLRQKKTLTGAG